MPAQTYRFDRFCLETARRNLLRDDKPVPLGARAFDLLVQLIEGRSRIMSKDELLRAVWPDSVVDENNLTVNISGLRRALGQGDRGPQFIRTVPGRGYRFVAELRHDPPATSPARAVEALRPPDRPSIAVLPFVNKSTDPEQDHFGDGIAEDIISELSRHRWLMVIARGSSFQYRGSEIQIQDVAGQFGVRYVLEGSIRKAGDRTRITARLIDAATSFCLTAVQYDRDMTDVFTAQDEITTMIATAIRPVLYEAEEERSLRRHPDSIDAWSAYQRGMWHFSHFEKPETAAACGWFEQAIRLDPHFAQGYVGLSLVYLSEGSGFVGTMAADWQARGEALARRAILLDERNSAGHSMLGLGRMVYGDHAGAIEATLRALDLNPSDATAHATLGATLVFVGRLEEGLQTLATSLRLSPRDSRLRVRHSHIGLGHYFGRDYARAEATAQEIIQRWPSFHFGPRLLALVLAETGRLTEARIAIGRAIALQAMPFDDFSQARMPWYRKDDHARVVRALRLAGWQGLSR